MRPRSTHFVAGILLALGACANHTYVPGPGKSAAELGRDSGLCHLYAAGTRPDTSFEAYGSPKAVAIESGVALLAGGIATAVHDSETYDYCMQARGWLVKDNSTARAQPAIATTAAPPAEPVAAFPAVPQPVMQSALPPLADEPFFPGEPISPGRARQITRAQAAAQSWLAAQAMLNGPDSAQRRSLYAALCKAGDRSSCLMAGM